MPGVRKFKGFMLIIWLIAAILIIRVLAIDSLSIESPAGKPVLQPGDNVLISKIHYGPRLPFINRRIQGLSRIRPGDLVAYNFPEGDTVPEGMESVSYYSLIRKKESENDTASQHTGRFKPLYRRTPEVSRCIGLPGDTVYIVGTHNWTHDYASLRNVYDYLAEVRDRQLPLEFLARLELDPSEMQILPGLGYLMPLRADQVSMVRQRPEVYSLEIYLLEPGRGDYNIFPHDVRYPWNRDNFGPVIVPKNGDFIRLTLLNLCLYRRIIEVYEKNRLEVRNESIHINGSPAETYTFKQDYYFVMGDNRHHSRDSRHWGFLPEDHIIGKPLFNWFSGHRTAGQPYRIYWNRIFNTLR